MPNIRSTNRNLQIFKNYISQLKVNWTFISVTENWGKPHTIWHMHIPGYKHVYDVRTDRISGGCSLYIHDTIPFKQRKDLALGGESVFIEVNGKIFNTNKNVILTVIYRSPDLPLSLFNEQLEHTLLQIDKEKKVIHNCGTYRELSVNLVVTQALINIFSSFNYQKLITQPTRIVR